MPLPHSAERFLDCAFLAATPSCIIHFYSIANENNPFAEAEMKIKEEAKKAGKQVSILNRHIVRPYAPHIVQVVLDFQVS
jgi:tRNA (guanine37-N1)-methyltransferase